MSKPKRYRKTILTDASGCGSVNLPVSVAKVGDATVDEGVGTVAIEALASSNTRLMVTGGTLDGQVTVSWDQLP